LKRCGDWAFCQGVNRMVFHQYTHQPTEDAPGFQFGAGTHIDRHLTWWKMASPWLTYIARCQHLLQSGRFHADLCYFYGEGSAKYVPAKEHLHPPLPPGYNFDCVNADILLNRLTVQNGRLVLPEGVSYRMLLLPAHQAMSPAVLRRIRKLIEAGAAVLGEKPLHAPGLTDWPRADEQVKTLADAMWGSPSATSGQREIGRGRLIWGKTPAEALAALGVPPDFEAASDNKDFQFIHRVIGDADVYFLSNQADVPRQADCLFRISGRRPELGDPVAGTLRDLPRYSPTGDGRLRVPLALEPGQSFFIVFRQKADAPSAPGKEQNFFKLEPLAEVAGPWQVEFDPRWGGQNATFDKLQDWTQRPEKGIQYYSGTAVYRTTFDLSDPAVRENKRRLLDLGKVNYLARVRLNGRDLGVLWTAPWRVDVTGLLKEKNNSLEIEVANTWWNRIAGDARLPAEKRFAKTNVPYDPQHPPMPSGLLGPVTVQGLNKD
jgi:hypothetical protein